MYRSGVSEEECGSWRQLLVKRRMMRSRWAPSTSRYACIAMHRGRPFILSMRGRVVSNVVDFAGPYNELLGELKSDVQEVEFDDVNRGDRPVQRIHIFNPTEEMMEPVVMHLPNLSPGDGFAIQGGTSPFRRDYLRAGFQETA